MGVSGSHLRGGDVGVSAHGSGILEEGAFAANAIDQKLVKGLRKPIRAAPHPDILGFSPASPLAAGMGASSGAGVSATGCVGLAL